MKPEQLAYVLANPKKAAAEVSLIEFAKQAWHAIEPDVEFVVGHAVEAIAAHLEAVTRGDIKRLLINVPPGCTKSMLVNVLWPAWEWGPQRNMSYRYISAGYEQGLATRDLVRCRDLVESEWYRARWPITFKDDQNQKTLYENTRTGWRKSAGVGSSIVGYRGDRIIIDDPHSIKTAESELERMEALRWFSETVPTRMNKQAESAIVVIMQRLHERDISGLIMDELADEYTILMLPMEYEPDRKCSTSVKWTPPGEDKAVPFEDWRTEVDELLWEERFPRDAVESLKKALRAHGGTYAESAQLQQRPTVRGGGLFKRDDFKLWEGALPEGRRIVRGWDLAASKSSRSAYTAGVRMSQLLDGRIIIEDVVRERLGPFEVEQRIKTCAVADGVDCYTSIPQDPGAAGLAWKEHMAVKMGGHIVHFSTESGDKDYRAGPFAAQVEAGLVYYLAGSWVAVYLSEAASFGPGAAYKDQMDASSRAYAIMVKDVGQTIALLPPTLFLG